MIDFVELSKNSLNKYRYSLGSVDTERYKKTLYVAISENDEVSCSYDSDILSGAFQCILIHCKSELAVSNWYERFKVEFINHNGQNLGGIIGNDCYFKINWIGSWGNQVLKLYHGDVEIYSCNPPFEGHMQRLWDVYCNTLNKNKNAIEDLKAELFKKEKRISELEEQITRYKQMISGIKEIIKELGE